MVALVSDRFQILKDQEKGFFFSTIQAITYIELQLIPVVNIISYIYIILEVCNTTYIMYSGTCKAHWTSKMLWPRREGDLLAASSCLTIPRKTDTDVEFSVARNLKRLSANFKTRKANYDTFWCQFWNFSGLRVNPPR